MNNWIFRRDVDSMISMNDGENVGLEPYFVGLKKFKDDINI